MFSCFASASSLRANINGGVIGGILNSERGGGINEGVNRRSLSTLKSAMDMASDMDKAPTSSTTDMIALSKKIAQETEKLEKYMKENGLIMPSFDVDAADDFPKLPAEMQKSRLEIIHATKELRDLAVGPRESVRWGVWEVSSYLITTSVRNFVLMFSSTS